MDSPRLRFGDDSLDEMPRDAATAPLRCNGRRAQQAVCSRSTPCRRTPTISPPPRRRGSRTDASRDAHPSADCSTTRSASIAGEVSVCRAGRMAITRIRSGDRRHVRSSIRCSSPDRSTLMPSPASGARLARCRFRRANERAHELALDLRGERRRDRGQLPARNAAASSAL